MVTAVMLQQREVNHSVGIQLDCSVNDVLITRDITLMWSKLVRANQRLAEAVHKDVIRRGQRWFLIEEGYKPTILNSWMVLNCTRMCTHAHTHTHTHTDLYLYTYTDGSMPTDKHSPCIYNNVRHTAVLNNNSKQYVMTHNSWSVNFLPKSLQANTYPAKLFTYYLKDLFYCVTESCW